MFLHIFKILLVTASFSLARCSYLHGSVQRSSPNIQHISYQEPDAHIPEPLVPIISNKSFRSMFRSVYFTYQFYHPELSYGICLMRFASNPGFKFVPQGNESIAYLSQHIRIIFERMIVSANCSNTTNDVAMQQEPNCWTNDDAAPVLTPNDNVNKTILLNIFEKWLRSLDLLRPIMETITTLDIKQITDNFESTFYRFFNTFRFLIHPELLGCTQRYLNEFVWRTVESYIID